MERRTQARGSPGNGRKFQTLQSICWSVCLIPTLALASRQRMPCSIAFSRAVLISLWWGILLECEWWGGRRVKIWGMDEWVCDRACVCSSGGTEAKLKSLGWGWVQACAGRWIWVLATTAGKLNTFPSILWENWRITFIRKILCGDRVKGRPPVKI